MISITLFYAYSIEFLEKIHYLLQQKTSDDLEINLVHHKLFHASNSITRQELEFALDKEDLGDN